MEPRYFLNEKKLEVVIPVDSALLNRPPEWVEIPVVEVKNPDGPPFVVSIFLEKTGKPGPEYHLPLGFFALYPPDEPANLRFRFDQTATQLRKICGARDSTHRFQLRLIAEPSDSLMGLRGVVLGIAEPRFGGKN